VNTAIREALADLATDAGRYADAEAAVHTARRRRTGRAVAATAAVLVLALLAGSAALVLRRGRSDPAPTAGYPAAVTVSARLDPATAPGNAAFILRGCRFRVCDAGVVLPDGRRFMIQMDGTVLPHSLTLSPDGRYAGWRYAGPGYHLYDLVTGTVRVVAADGPGPLRPMAWSPDGRWLVLAASTPESLIYTYTLVDVRTGQVQRLDAVRVPYGERVAGITNSRHLLVIRYEPLSLPGVRVVDPDSGLDLRTVTLQAPPGSFVLRTGESVRGMVVAPCGCTAAISVMRRGYEILAAVLIADLATGAVNARIDLPDALRAESHPEWQWDVRGHGPHGVVLVRHDDASTEIELLNDVTGTRTVVTRLPAETDIVARGGVSE